MLKNVTLAGIAAAFALSVLAVAPVSARPVVGQLSQISGDAAVDLVKKKKKKSKKSKAGKCGEYKYWSKKGKKCADARDKK